jgi:hypothetical protein
MGRKDGLYPISEEHFNEVVLPVIVASYRGKNGRRTFHTTRGVAG